MKKLPAFIAIALTAILLIYAIEEFPGWADPNQPSSVHVSPRYIEKTIEETAIPNIVTAVLADYRSYDTLFETVVIFIAGIVVVMLLRRPKKW